MRRLFLVPVMLITISCAGMSKACSQTVAGAFGTDWIVVQFDYNGKIFNCWKLEGAVVDSGTGGNVDWKDTKDGHLVHITGWENRVQVEHHDFASAAKIIGVDINQCNNGKY